MKSRPGNLAFPSVNGVTPWGKGEDKFLIGKSGFNTISYKKEGWFDIPLPHELPILLKVFPHVKYELLVRTFMLLYMRALDNGGDTKMSNGAIAKFLSSPERTVSERTVSRYIRKLKEKKFLVYKCKLHTQYGKHGGIIRLPNGKPMFKTERIIRVWQAFAECGYKPLPSDRLMMKRDIRPECSLTVKTIPLKYKIQGDIEFWSVKKMSFQTVKSEAIKFDELVQKGYIHYGIYCEMENLKDLQGEAHHLGFSSLGYCRKNYIYRKKKRLEYSDEVYKDNKEIIDNYRSKIAEAKREAYNNQRY